MLVLSRKVDEKLFIEVGDQVIEMILCSIDRNKTRIGFIADSDHVRIYRQEVYVNVLRERASRKGEDHAEDSGLDKTRV